MSIVVVVMVLYVPSPQSNPQCLYRKLPFALSSSSPSRKWAELPALLCWVGVAIPSTQVLMEFRENGLIDISALSIALTWEEGKRKAKKKEYILEL